jgi:hypothetical protein
MASTTSNLGLRRWDSQSDLFSYSELSNNWTLLDQHDHTTGKGVQIPAAGLATGAVTSPKIAASAVDGTKLADGSVTAVKLGAGAVGYSQVALDASAPNAGSFSAYLSTTTNLSSNAVVPFDTVEWDLNGWYSTTTNRYTPQIKGLYHVMASIGTSSSVNIKALLTKNGTEARRGAAGTTQAAVSALVNMNGTTDYLQIVCTQTLGSPATMLTGANQMYFQAYLVARRT